MDTDLLHVVVVVALSSVTQMCYTHKYVCVCNGYFFNISSVPCMDGCGQFQLDSQDGLFKM